MKNKLEYIKEDYCVLYIDEIEIINYKLYFYIIYNLLLFLLRYNITPGYPGIYTKMIYILIYEIFKF